MDKFDLSCYKTGKTVLAAFGFLLLAIFGAAAQENAWSFEDNPQPRSEEMTSAERKFLDDTKNPALNAGACATFLTRYYKIYQNHYPDFQKTGDAETRFRSWKLYQARTGYYISCLSFVVWEELSEIDLAGSFDDFYFCGLYSRPPATAAEREAAKYIDELFEYAKNGSSFAISTLLTANRLMEIVEMNPDVEYYISRLVVAEFKGERPPRYVSHLEPLLSEERRAFVDRAAENFDLQAVLDTTEPCAPRAAG